MPRTAVILATVAALLALAAPATALSPPVPELPLDRPLHADVDGDGVRETLRFRETACFDEDGVSEPPCPPGQPGQRDGYVELVDDCGQNRITTRLTRHGHGAIVGELVDANGDGLRRELAVEVRSGATGRGVDSRVIAFRRDEADCARKRDLFRFPTRATRGRAPRGSRFQTGTVKVGEYDRRRRGRELRVDSFYLRTTDGECCPTFRRRTIWRYDRERGRYVRLRSTVSRA